MLCIDHTYIYIVPGAKGNQEQRIQGTLYFEPSRCFCLRGYKNSVDVVNRGELTMNWKYEVEFDTIDDSSRFPIIKRQTMHQIQSNYMNKKHLDITTIFDYNLAVKETPPNSDFTLAAFGIPEPGSEPVKKPIPIYVWILVSAGVCAALALSFRYLARRIRTRPAT